MKTQKTFTGLLLLLAIALAWVVPVQAAKTPTVQDHITAIADASVKIHGALASDSVKDVRKNAADIVKSADAAIKLAAKDKKKNAKLIDALNGVITAAADYGKGLKKDEEIKIDAARENFYPLSSSIIELVKGHLPEKAAAKYTMFHCPMAKGYWLQSDAKKLRNPYYGSEMLECGKKTAIKDYDPKKCKCHDKHEHGKLDESKKSEHKH
jgi:hypothetical protein